MRIRALVPVPSKMLVLACVVASSAACNLIQVKQDRTMTYHNADGTVTVKHEHWEGTLDQLPSHMGKQLTEAGDQLATATTKMVKQLKDVPPPGKVKLGDLGPGMGKFEGNPQTDYLLQAKDDDGNPIAFEYVQLGVPSYDAFFKQAQQVFALCYQANQTLEHMATLSGQILNTKVAVDASLSASVTSALGQANADASAVAQLKAMQDLAASVGTQVAQIAKGIDALVATGKALILSAPTSLTNPKVLLHLGLVKDGLTDSVKVIKSSGELMGGMTGSFTGFGGGGGSASN